MAGIIQKAAGQSNVAQKKAGQTLNGLINSFLDKEGLRRRFDELLDKRAPQFVSSLVSLLNATPQLQEAFYKNPMSVVQAALKAATFDLPIDPSLGYAYIVPFNNSTTRVPEATFIMGYKGMQQLALRTGAYETINVVDIRAGELKSYNRLTEEIDIDFVEDDDERDKLDIIGYVGYFKLINGTKKTIYMSVKQIEAHERKHRKGKYMGKGWKDNFQAMCSKTVMRRLLGKWGLMSIDYQRADSHVLAAAEAISRGQFDDEDVITTSEYTEVTQSNAEQMEDKTKTGSVTPEDDTPLPWDDVLPDVGA